MQFTVAFIPHDDVHDDLFCVKRDGMVYCTNSNRPDVISVIKEHFKETKGNMEIWSNSDTMAWVKSLFDIVDREVPL